MLFAPGVYIAINSIYTPCATRVLIAHGANRMLIANQQSKNGRYFILLIYDHYIITLNIWL